MLSFPKSKRLCLLALLVSLLLAASISGIGVVAEEEVDEEVADEEVDEEEEESYEDDGLPPKRLGHKKVKVEGSVFASYGLSPRTGSPKRVVEYSKRAVEVASSSAKTSAAGSSSSSSLPAKVDLRPYLSAVENQANSNSCAANAVAGAYEYLATRAALRDGEETVGEISRLFIYYVGRKRDQVLWGEDTKKRPKDTGMTLHGAIEAVQLKGAALQRSWPFELHQVNRKPPREAFQEAIRYKVGDAMNIPLDLDQMRQCLSDGYPIIFGLKLTSAFFAPPYDGFIPTPDPTDPQSARHGLHAMLIVGYNDRQRVFIVRNSWGTKWGVDGYCFLGYDYVVNPAFNFVGQYAIQSLTDDDLTPDEDDGHDMDQRVDPSNITPHFEIETELVYGGDDLIDDDDDDDDDDIDADDMFDTQAEARRAFHKFASTKDGRDLSVESIQLSRDELRDALMLMGIPMVTETELDYAMTKYDDDGSGYITFDEFLDMQSLFDGTLLERRRLWKRIQEKFSVWSKKILGKSDKKTLEEESSDDEENSEL